MPHQPNLPKGAFGETLALSFLKQRDYHILTSNFRCRLGEIDIIAEKHNVLIFVEVKTRWTSEYGSPYEAVTPRKIRSISKTGLYYKSLHPKLPNTLQIDVISIEIDPKTQKHTIEHLENVTS